MRVRVPSGNKMQVQVLSWPNILPFVQNIFVQSGNSKSPRICAFFTSLAFIFFHCKTLLSRQYGHFGRYDLFFYMMDFLDYYYGQLWQRAAIMINKHLRSSVLEPDLHLLLRNPQLAGMTIAKIEQRLYLKTGLAEGVQMLRVKRWKNLFQFKFIKIEKVQITSRVLLSRHCPGISFARKQPPTAKRSYQDDSADLKD